MAVSGGIDSMVLLHVLKHAKYDFHVAHCNFQLRGRASELEALHVKAICKRYAIPYYVKKFDTVLFAQENKLSIEMAARKLRYDWFEKLLNKHELDFLVVAHHQKDQVETFFINLCRGSGIHGLTGMRMKSENKILRPMLQISKDKITAYALANKIKYYEDKSNKEDIYQRNKIRNTIIPLFETFNPNFICQAERSIEYLKQTEQFVENQLEKLREEIIQRIGQSVYLNTELLLKQQDVHYLLFELLREFGFYNEQISQIYLALSISGKQFYSDSHCAITNRNTLVIRPLNRDENDLVRLSYITVNKAKLKMTNDPQIAYLDLSCLMFPLQIRKWQQGDTFHPLGMKGRMKVSDFFINQKFSLFEKESACLLESNGSIVWIIGHRIDDRFKVTDSTTEVLIARI